MIFDINIFLSVQQNPYFSVSISVGQDILSGRISVHYLTGQFEAGSRINASPRAILGLTLKAIHDNVKKKVNLCWHFTF